MVSEFSSAPGTSTSFPSSDGTTGAPGQGAGANGQPAMDEAKEKRRQLADRARTQANDRMESGLRRGKEQAATTLASVAQQLVSSSHQLRDQRRDNVGRYAEEAGQRLQRPADYLQHTDMDEIVNRVEDVARRQPALFRGGAFALGVLGARFLRSSRRNARGRYAASRERAPERGAFTGGQSVEYATPGYEAAERAGVTERGQRSVGELPEGAKRTAVDLKHRAQEVVGQTADRASHVASTVSSQAKEQAWRVEDRFQETPLAISAVTFALGLAAGMAIPPTEREVKLMGDTRDRVVDRASDAARETTDKVQQVATRVMDETRSTTSAAGREQEPTA